MISQPALFATAPETQASRCNPWRFLCVRGSALVRTILQEKCLVLVCMVWFMSSAIGTMINKRIMMRHAHPDLLSLVHLVLGGALDFAVLHAIGYRTYIRSASRPSPSVSQTMEVIDVENGTKALSDAASGPAVVTETQLNTIPASVDMDSFVGRLGAGLYRVLRPFIPCQLPLFVACIPVAVAMLFGKLLTYLSYEVVPVSLTHTVKASSPVFSVLLMRFVYGKDLPRTLALMSLAPITIGVTMAAVSEINFNVTGFISALVAAFAAVWQSIFAKRGLAVAHTCASAQLKQWNDDSAAPAPDESMIHLNLPCVGNLLRPSQRSIHTFHALRFHMYTCFISLLFLVPYCGLQAWRSSGSEPAKPTADVEVESWAMLVLSALASVLCAYLQQVCSLLFLKSVSVVTYQVSNTLRRFLIIVSSVMIFKNAMTVNGYLAIVIALTGFLTYSLAVKAPASKTAAGDATAASADGAAPSRRAGHSDVEMGLLSPPVAPSRVGSHESSSGGGHAGEDGLREQQLSRIHAATNTAEGSFLVGSSSPESPALRVSPNSAWGLYSEVQTASSDSTMDHKDSYEQFNEFANMHKKRMMHSNIHGTGPQGRNLGEYFDQPAGSASA